MKGGKDMIRTYNLIDDVDKYSIVDESNEEIIDISKKTLNVEGKKIYEKFFADFKQGDSIIFNKDDSIDTSEDKLAIAVYNNVKEIIEKIVDNINNASNE